MRKCPYCAEEIIEDALVCRHCGRTAVPEEMRKHLEGWGKMGEEARNRYWATLSEEQRAAFMTAWEGLGYKRIAAGAGPDAIDNKVPAIASLIIPGAGQFMQGRTTGGLLFLFGGLLLWAAAAGWLIHILAAVDAYRWDPKMAGIKASGKPATVARLGKPPSTASRIVAYSVVGIMLLLLLSVGFLLLFAP